MLKEPLNPSALWSTSAILFLLRKGLRIHLFPVQNLAIACSQNGQAHHSGLSTVRITETPEGIHRTIIHKVPFPFPAVPTLPAVLFPANTSLRLTSSQSLSSP